MAQSDAQAMDVRIIKPFLEGAIRVLTTMAMIEPVPGKPLINEDQYVKGAVSAIISIDVLKTMAQVDAKPGKPFLKKDDLAMGDVSAIIGVTGAAQGPMALIFTEQCIKYIASNLLGEPFTQLNPEVRDAVGELTNMICGDARRRLAEFAPMCPARSCANTPMDMWRSHRMTAQWTP